MYVSRCIGEYERAVCAWERERERESVCVCVCVSEWVSEWKKERKNERKKLELNFLHNLFIYHF